MVDSVQGPQQTRRRNCCARWFLASTIPTKPVRAIDEDLVRPASRLPVQIPRCARRLHTTYTNHAIYKMNIYDMRISRVPIYASPSTHPRAPTAIERRNDRPLAKTRRRRWNLCMMSFVPPSIASQKCCHRVYTGTCVYVRSCMYVCMYVCVLVSLVWHCVSLAGRSRSVSGE